MNGIRQESGNANKRAYQISYAVFRIASRIGNVALKEHLERQALALLDAAAVENYAWVSIVSRAIESLIRFGADVGLINEVNKDVILNELKSMDFDAANAGRSATLDEIPLGDIFKQQDPLFRHGARPINPSVDEEKSVHSAMGFVYGKESGKNHESGNTEPIAIESGNVANSNGIAAGIRQSAILQKLRESGNCRMRELQTIFPNYSERTLRYDLQILTEQNLVERIGSGGPSVYYRIRQ